MVSRLSVFCIVALTLASAAFGQDLKGKWTAEMKSDGELNVQMRYGNDSMLGEDIALTQLQGLSAEALASPSQDVDFKLQREAGTVTFTGHFRNGDGVGEYAFHADPAYVGEMAKLGYSNIEARKLLTMAVLDVTTTYTKELLGLGFKPDTDKLIAARIFHVDREEVEGMRTAGFDGLSLDKLIELHIHGVTPEYVRQMRAAGFDGSLDELIQTKIFKVTPEFREQMASAGYPHLSESKLVEFRIHGITPEYVRQLKALGFNSLSADDLVQAKIFRVDAEQIRELSAAGYGGLSLDQLVQARIHHIDAAFITKVQNAGYKHPDMDQLVQFKIMGIPRRVAEY